MREEAFLNLLKMIVEQPERGIIYEKLNITAVIFKSLNYNVNKYKLDHSIRTDKQPLVWQ